MPAAWCAASWNRARTTTVAADGFFFWGGVDSIYTAAVDVLFWVDRGTTAVVGFVRVDN